MNWLLRLLKAVLDYLAGPTTPRETPQNRSDKAQVNEPTPTPPPPPTPDNAAILYQTAKAALGQKLVSNTDMEFGCAEAVEIIHHRAFGSFVGNTKLTMSTFDLYHLLKADPTFKQVDTPQPGDIVISPTGLGDASLLPHGHTGICAVYGIMSNDSSNGRWQENYSFAGWVRHFHEVGKYPVYYFRKV